MVHGLHIQSLPIVVALWSTAEGQFVRSVAFVFNSKDSKRGRKTGLMKLSKSVTYTELVIDRLNLVCTTLIEASVPSALQIL